jgi:hypothetical protein
MFVLINVFLLTPIASHTGAVAVLCCFIMPTFILPLITSSTSPVVVVVPATAVLFVLVHAPLATTAA